MARKIKINFRIVYDTGVSYEILSSDLKRIQEEMRAISNGVLEAWSGVDSQNFNISFLSHVEELNSLISFLEFKSDLLKKTALNHNAVDKEFLEKIKRSDMDEQRIKY